MKSKIAKVLKCLTDSRPHYYHHQWVATQLERELQRAYAIWPVTGINTQGF